MSDVEKNIGTHKPEFDGEWVRLGDVIKKAKSARCGSDSYPILSITMRDGIVEQASRFKKSIASRDTGNYKVVEPGQLVVGFPIDEGVINVQNFNYPGIMSPAYDVWDIDSSRVDPSYLELALHSPQSMDYYRSNLRGTTARRRSLPTNTLCDLTFPLPSLEIQRIVVKRMSMIATLLDDAGSRLSALDDLVKSQFVEMFGGYGADSEYGCARLGKLLSVEPQNGLYKPQRYYRTDCGGTPIVRVDAFSNGSVFSYASLNRLDCSESELENYALHEGDIVMNRVNGSIERVGKVALIKGLNEATVYESNMMRFHVDECRLNATYIVHVLCSDDIRKQIKSCARIANQCSVNQENVVGLQVPLPPLALQQQFADFVARVDKLGFDVQQQIEKLETLKQSLMQEYFG